MRFTSDHAFHIGSQHLRGGLPCQDYALSGADVGITYAIVSDGCSTGGRTDVGARVVGLSAASTIPEVNDLNVGQIDKIMGWRIADAQDALGLQTSDLLATCGYVAVNQEIAAARIIGDGVIAAKSSNGLISMTRIDWANNMPLYRAYSHDSYAGFIAAHGGDLDRDAATSTHQFWSPSVRDREPRARHHPLGDMLTGFSHSFDPGSCDFVAVFSDGITQVDGMDWRDVVAELLAFKSTEGDFVKRRMNRFLKDCQKHGKGPIDDISMACIHIDHEVA